MISGEGIRWFAGGEREECERDLIFFWIGWIKAYPTLTMA